MQFTAWCGSRRRACLGVVAVAGLFAIGGCQRGAVSQTGDGPSTEELVQFYSPRSIKILPFTKVRSFDSDDVPDGISVSLCPLDAAGDPVKAYGTFMFELYRYKNGSTNRRGDLVRTWSQSINNLKDQKAFWVHVTRTYEFPLSWEGSPIPPQQKYILVASFQAPGGKRLFDEYEFEFRITREELLNAVGGEQKKAEPK